MTLPPPDHWHLSFGSAEVIHYDNVQAGRAFVDLCANMFAETMIDYDECVEKVAYYSATQPMLTLQMGMGSWTIWHIPCRKETCKRRSLN